MVFAVTKPGGTDDASFLWYAVALRWASNSLAAVPRVPDPQAPSRRWVCAWDTAEEAEAFAMTMRNQPGGDGTWVVEETDATVSVGPFGPLPVSMARRADGVSIALQPITLTMVRDYDPDSVPVVTDILIDKATLADFARKRGGFSRQVGEILPLLTGLSPDALADIGYFVYDENDDRTFVHVPPAGLILVPA